MENWLIFVNFIWFFLEYLFHKNANNIRYGFDDAGITNCLSFMKKTNLNPQKITIISKTLDFSGFFVIILKFGWLWLNEIFLNDFSIKLTCTFWLDDGLFQYGWTFQLRLGYTHRWRLCEQRAPKIVGVCICFTNHSDSFNVNHNTNCITLFWN